MHLRQVTLEEANAKAQELDIMFMETSAKAGHNVKSLFKKIAMSLVGMEKENEAAETQNTSTYVLMTDVCMALIYSSCRDRRNITTNERDSGRFPVSMLSFRSRRVCRLTSVLVLSLYVVLDDVYTFALCYRHPAILLYTTCMGSSALHILLTWSLELQQVYMLRCFSSSLHRLLTAVHGVPGTLGVTVSILRPAFVLLSLLFLLLFAKCCTILFSIHSELFFRGGLILGSRASDGS